jgi:hypothetical protein
MGSRGATYTQDYGPGPAHSDRYPPLSAVFLMSVRRVVETSGKKDTEGDEQLVATKVV